MDDANDLITEPNQIDHPLSLQRIISEQKLDTSIDQLTKWVARHELPTKDELSHQNPFDKSLAQHIDQLVIEQGALVSREVSDSPTFRIIIPPSLVEEVIYEAHEGVGASHEGVE